MILTDIPARYLLLKKNNFTKIIITILIAVIVAVLFSCNHNSSNKSNEDVQTSLISALENFSTNKYVKINGNFNINELENNNY